MEIRLSDLIWTIICFGLFILVLNGLLIKPVLRLMDERKKRIAKARSHAAELEAADELERKKLAEQTALDESAAREERRARLELARKEAALEYEKLEASLKAHESEAANALSVSTEKARAKLAASMDAMVEAFTKKLISGGEKR